MALRGISLCDLTPINIAVCVCCCAPLANSTVYTTPHPRWYERGIYAISYQRSQNYVKHHTCYCVNNAIRNSILYDFNLYMVIVNNAYWYRYMSTWHYDDHTTRTEPPCNESRLKTNVYIKPRCTYVCHTFYIRTDHVDMFDGYVLW